jgi:hypothetical protein
MTALHVSRGFEHPGGRRFMRLSAIAGDAFLAAAAVFAMRRWGGLRTSVRWAAMFMF